MSVDKLKQLIGQEIIKAEVTDDRRLILETSSFTVSFEEVESEYDQGGAWLDITRLDPSTIIGGKILNFQYSSPNYAEPTKDIPPSYVTERNVPAAWELYIIETSKGMLDVWFYSTDGGHAFGEALVKITSK